jgi:chloramphenicol-sensitive protein RarD
VSLGYFLLPLTMVLTGRLWGEQPVVPAKIAVVFAGLGVLNELYQVGGFSWATLVVVIGYPVYFVVRKYLKTDNWRTVAGHGADAAGGMVVRTKRRKVSRVGSAPHGCRIDSHIGADQCVGAGELHYCQSFAGVQLVRLLSYVEPVLLLGVALLLGERIKAGEWLTYIPIWLAVMVLVYEGFKHLVRQRRA